MLKIIRLPRPLKQVQGPRNDSGGLNQKGFAAIFVILALVLISIGIAIFLSRRMSKSNKSFIPSFDQTADCPKDLSGVFTNSFVDPDKILAIRPLGYTTGRDHILPVDHA